MKITGKLKVTMNNAIWNVRAEPNTTSAIVGQTKANEVFETAEIETLGQVIDGNSCWAKYGQGWTSMGQVVSCVTLGNDTQCQVELVAAKVQISSLTTQLGLSKSEVDRLTIELGKYKLDIPRYIKAV